MFQRLECKQLERKLLADEHETSDLPTSDRLGLTTTAKFLQSEWPALRRAIRSVCQ